MRSNDIRIRPDCMAIAVVSISATAIITALLLVRYIPSRFQIHPYPYLSDAGLRDPERVILSFGLSLSATLFIPVSFALRLMQQSQLDKARRAGLRFPELESHFKPFMANKCLSRIGHLNCAMLPQVGNLCGIFLAFFLALFTAIPGWFFFHHIFAVFFAISAALWCLCHSIFTYRVCKTISPDKPRFRRRNIVRFMLVILQVIVVLLFGVVWLSVKLHFPYKMIPNKDFRFVILAFLEYLGTASFLTFVSMVSQDLSKSNVLLSLSLCEAENKSDV